MDRHNAGRGGAKSKRPTAKTTRPAPAYSDMTPEKIAKQTRSIVLKLVRKLHDDGRLSTLQQLTDFLKEADFNLFRWQQSDELVSRPELLRRFLLSFPLIFYVGDTAVVNGSIYVGLTRDCTHYNARFAMGLSEVHDDELESPLLWQGDDKPLLQRPDSSAPEYQDYLLAKASIAILRVLEVLEGSMKKGFLRWTAVEGVIPSIKQRLGPLGEALIWYCSTENDFETGLIVFFYLIHGVFKIDDEAIRLDSVRLQGIWTATETDLIWSATAICLSRGVSTESEMVARLLGFVQKRKLRYDRIINEAVVKRQLKFWHLGLFLPGDGTIHRVPHTTPAQEKQLQKLEETFILVLRNAKFGRISYKSCRKILEKRLPNFADWDVCKNSASIAANLCRTGSFFIDKGIMTISETIKTPRLNLSIGNLNIEVPRSAISLGKRPKRLSMEQIKGSITEIGLRSAIIACDRFDDRCKKKSARGKNKSKAAAAAAAAPSPQEKLFAFCHVEETTFRGKEIGDFTVLFDVGDRVNFSFTQDSPHVRRPCYIFANDIKRVPSYMDDEDTQTNSETLGPCTNPVVTRSKHQPKWRKRYLALKKKRKKIRDGQASASRCDESDDSSSSTSSSDSLPTYKEAIDARKDLEIEGARRDVRHGLLLGSSDSRFVVDVQYLPPGVDPNALTWVSHYVPPRSVDTMEIQYDGELIRSLSQAFEEKLTLSSTASTSLIAEAANYVPGESVSNDEGSIRAKMIESMIRSIGWTQVLPRIGFSEQQMIPTGYSPKSNGSWITNMAWEAISKLSEYFIFTNDLPTFISLLMSPWPVYLMELTPADRGREKEDDDDDDNKQGPSSASSAPK